MGGRKVGNMDIVPDARPVGRGIIISENAYGVALPQRNLHDNGYQMSFGAVVFADIPADMGARGVKIPQGCIFDSVSVIRPF